MKQIIFILMIGMVLVGCENAEFLEESNPNQIATDNYWQNLTETNATLNATYSVLFNHYVLGIVEESWRSDMGWPGYGRPTPGSELGRAYYFKTYTDDDEVIEFRWNALYQGVFRANQVIEGLEALQGTVNEEEWTLQMAQARFFRGLFHFYLHSTFNNGNIIIKDKVPGTQEEFNKGVSPSAEVIAFFREDLSYAYANLPAKWENKQADQGRVTAGTAATILGTSYLYEEEYDRALPMFNDVIDNTDYGYRLVSPEVLFTKAGEFNDESIFEINYNLTHRPELNQWDESSHGNRLVFSFGGVDSAMPAWILYKYKTESMDPLDDRNYYVDPIEGRKLRNVPLRASQMVTLAEDEQTLYYLTDNVSANMQGNPVEWGFGHLKKYFNHDHLESEDENPGGNWFSGKNVTVNRLADVYLMRAEVKIKMGDITGALADINAVRARWGLVLLGPVLDASHSYDSLSYTAETLMNHLMYVEKPLELSNEGQSIRWNDLRRWGIIGENFNRLAGEVYHTVTYQYTNVEGDLGWRNNSLQEGPDTGDATHVIDYAYDLTAENYVPELHDYLPIPLSEVLANSAITE